jgi:integrase
VRIAETLRLRWGDVDFKHRQLTIGADGLAKNRKPRVVDLNAELERHLSEHQLIQMFSTEQR